MGDAEGEGRGDGSQPRGRRLRKLHTRTLPIVQCKLPLERITDFLSKLTNSNKQTLPPPPPPPPRIMCLFCERTFISEKLSQKHTERSHRVSAERRSSARHAERPAPNFHPGCNTCCNNSGLQTAADLPALFNHLIDQHSIDYIACRLCKIRFSTRLLLNCHNREIHGITGDSVSEGCSRTTSPAEPETEVRPSLPRRCSSDERQRTKPSTLTRTSSVKKNSKCKIMEGKNSEKNKNSEVSSGDLSLSEIQQRLLNMSANKKNNISDPNLASEESNIDFEENIVTNLIIPQGKTLSADVLDKKLNIDQSAVILLDDIGRDRNLYKMKDSLSRVQIDPGTHDNQILSRLGVTQNRSPRARSLRKQRKLPVLDTRASSESSRREKQKLKSDITEFVINKNKNDPGSKFDPDFYSNVSVNVRENLMKHLDGKLGKKDINCDFPNVLDPKVASTHAVMTQPAEIHGSDVGLNAITVFPTLLTSDQYGSDKIPHYSYGAKIQTFKKIVTKNSWKWKWDPIKKYKYCNEDGKIIRKVRQLQHASPRDLSKLDIWTQLSMREKFDKHFAPSDPSDVFENLKCERQKQVNELNTILDKRVFPEIEKEGEQAKNVESEAASEDIKCTEILIEKKVEIDDNQPSCSPLLESLGLVAKETQKCVPALPVLSGEWARPRCYVCCVCGRRAACLRLLEQHQVTRHPHVQATHYELVGRDLLNTQLYKHLYLPAVKRDNPVSDVRKRSVLGRIRDIPARVLKMDRSSRILRTTARNIKSLERQCTKCEKMLQPGELYKHILECAGDYGWIMAKKKCKYKPFGARKRRLKGLYKRERPQDEIDRPDKATRPKLPPRPRTKPSDAETIQRMLANLPAKRASRQILSLPPRPKAKGFTNIKKGPRNLVSTKLLTTVKSGLGKKVRRITRSIKDNLQATTSNKAVTKPSQIKSKPQGEPSQKMSPKRVILKKNTTSCNESASTENNLEKNTRSRISKNGVSSAVTEKPTSETNIKKKYKLRRRAVVSSKIIKRSESRFVLRTKKCALVKKTDQPPENESDAQSDNEVIDTKESSNDEKPLLKPRITSTKKLLKQPSKTVTSKKTVKGKQLEKDLTTSETSENPPPIQEDIKNSSCSLEITNESDNSKHENVIPLETQNNIPPKVIDQSGKETTILNIPNIDKNKRNSIKPRKKPKRVNKKKEVLIQTNEMVKVPSENIQTPQLVNSVCSQEIIVASRQSATNSNFSNTNNNNSNTNSDSTETRSTNSQPKNNLVSEVKATETCSTYDKARTFPSYTPLCPTNLSMHKDALPLMYSHTLEPPYITRSDEIDKPPLSLHMNMNRPSVQIDFSQSGESESFSKCSPRSKQSKSRRGLNDCIAMLKDKLTEKTSHEEEALNLTSRNINYQIYEESIQPLDLSGRIPQAEDLSIKSSTAISSIRKETPKKVIPPIIPKTPPKPQRKPVYDPTLRIPQYSLNPYHAKAANLCIESPKNKQNITPASLLIPTRKHHANMNYKHTIDPYQNVKGMDLPQLTQKLSMLPQTLVDTIQKFHPLRQEEIASALPQVLVKAVENIQLMRTDHPVKLQVKCTDNLLPLKKSVTDDQQRSNIKVNQPDKIYLPPKDLILEPICPSTNEISTQTITSNKEAVVQECPPEFHNVNTDLFLIDPVTGMIIERGSTSTEIVTADDKSAKEAVNQTNPICNSIINLTESIATDKSCSGESVPVKLFEEPSISPPISKPLNTESGTASLRAVRIKSANVKSKQISIESSAVEESQPSKDIPELPETSPTISIENTISSTKDLCHPTDVSNEENVTIISPIEVKDGAIQQDEVSSTQHSDCTLIETVVKTTASQPVIEVPQIEDQIIVEPEQVTEQRRVLRNSSKASEDDKINCLEKLKTVSKKPTKSKNKNDKFRAKLLDDINVQINECEKICKAQIHVSADEVPFKSTDLDNGQKPSFNKLLLSNENNIISETALTPSNAEFETDENNPEKNEKDQVSSFSKIDLENKEETSKRRSLRKNKTKSLPTDLDKISEKIDNLESSENCNDIYLNPDVSGSAIIPGESCQANLGNTETSQLPYIENQNPSATSVSLNEESDDDICLAMMAKKKTLDHTDKPNNVKEDISSKKMTKSKKLKHSPRTTKRISTEKNEDTLTGSESKEDTIKKVVTKSAKSKTVKGANKNKTEDVKSKKTMLSLTTNIVPVEENVPAGDALKPEIQENISQPPQESKKEPLSFPLKKRKVKLDVKKNELPIFKSVETTRKSDRLSVPISQDKIATINSVQLSENGHLIFKMHKEIEVNHDKPVNIDSDKTIDNNTTVKIFKQKKMKATTEQKHKKSLHKSPQRDVTAPQLNALIDVSIEKESPMNDSLPEKTTLLQEAKPIASPIKIITEDDPTAQCIPEVSKISKKTKTTKSHKEEDETIKNAPNAPQMNDILSVSLKKSKTRLRTKQQPKDPVEDLQKDELIQNSKVSPSIANDNHNLPQINEDMQQCIDIPVSESINKLDTIKGKRMKKNEKIELTLPSVQETETVEIETTIPGKKVVKAAKAKKGKITRNNKKNNSLHKKANFNIDLNILDDNETSGSLQESAPLSELTKKCNKNIKEHNFENKEDLCSTKIDDCKPTSFSKILSSKYADLEQQEEKSLEMDDVPLITFSKEKKSVFTTPPQIDISVKTNKKKVKSTKSNKKLITKRSSNSEVIEPTLAEVTNEIIAKKCGDASKVNDILSKVVDRVSELIPDVIESVLETEKLNVEHETEDKADSSVFSSIPNRRKNKSKKNLGTKASKVPKQKTTKQNKTKNSSSLVLPNEKESNDASASVTSTSIPSKTETEHISSDNITNIPSDNDYKNVKQTNKVRKSRKKVTDLSTGIAVDACVAVDAQTVVQLEKEKQSIALIKTSEKMVQEDTTINESKKSPKKVPNKKSAQVSSVQEVLDISKEVIQPSLSILTESKSEHKKKSKKNVTPDKIEVKVSAQEKKNKSVISVLKSKTNSAEDSHSKYIHPKETPKGADSTDLSPLEKKKSKTSVLFSVDAGSPKRIKNKLPASQPQRITRRRQTLAACELMSKDIDHLTSDEESMKQEKYLADFGMFTEKRPRKSTILAKKKIHQTFKPDLSDADDVEQKTDQTNPRRSGRPQKKRSRKTSLGTNSPARSSSAQRTTLLDSDDGLSADETSFSTKTKLLDTSTYCSICKRKFRRPDNLLKHNMTLMHISKISEIEAKQAMHKSGNDSTTNLTSQSFRKATESLNVTESKEEALSKTHKNLAERKSFENFHNDVIASPLKIANETPEHKNVNENQTDTDISRKQLSGDEALFFECCSLLKGSDTSRKQMKDVDPRKSTKYPEPEILYNMAVKNIPDETTNKSRVLLEEVVVTEKSHLLQLNPTNENNQKVTSIESEQEKEQKECYIETLPQYQKQRLIDNSDYETSTYKQNEYSIEKPVEKPFQFKKDASVKTHMTQNISDLSNSYKNESEVGNFLDSEIPKTITDNNVEHDPYSAETLMARMNMGEFSDNADSITSSHSNRVTPAPTLLEFEDKFDKIKRKAREKAQAATEAIAASRSHCKRVRRNNHSKPRKSSKQTNSHLKSISKSKNVHKKKSFTPHEKDFSKKVLTKGALKGFDGIKVSIPTQEINLSLFETSQSSTEGFGSDNKLQTDTHKSGQKQESKSKDKDTYVPEKSLHSDRTRYHEKKKSSSQNSTSREKYNTSAGAGSDDKQNVDIYEFYDDDYENNASDNFTFRTPLSFNSKDKGSAASSKRADNPDKCVMDAHNEDSQISSLSFSDRDDFMYMSDDYLGHQSEEETNLSSNSTEAITNVFKSSKAHKPTKVHNNIKKNAIMGKIFKNNAIRNDQKNLKDVGTEEYSKSVSISPQTNMDQLFDSLLEQTDNVNPTERSRPNSPDSPIDSRRVDCSSTSPPPAPRKIVPRLKARSSDDDNSTAPSPSNMSQQYSYEMNAEDYHDNIGVASRKSQRKCTTGKQNVLVESWSSESDYEDFRQFEEYSSIPRPQRHHRRPRRSGRHRTSENLKPAEAPVEELPSNAEETEESSMHMSSSTGRRVSFNPANSSNPNSKGCSSKRRRRQSQKPFDYDDEFKPTRIAEPLATQRRNKRAASEMLYYWSSSSDDDAPHTSAEPPSRETEPIEQHGWIVGDSHKKLVTMLAHAKGRKTDETSVKEKKARM